MKAFRFRLEAVLTLREQVEQAAQRAYSRALQAAEAAILAKRAAESEIVQLDQLQASRLAERLPATELEHLRNYRGFLQERLALRHRELAEAQRRAEEARLVLVAARRQREALERLREHQRRVYDYEVARGEQKILDEMAHRSPTLAHAWQEGDARN